MSEKYAGASWIKSTFKKEMSPLGGAVANLLGRVFSGIYHLDYKALSRVNWSNQYCVIFIYNRGLSTIDFDNLTKIVVFAHDEMIRFSIEGCGPYYMRMIFHQRKIRFGSVMECCPTIEDHIDEIRKIEKAE